MRINFNNIRFFTENNFSDSFSRMKNIALEKLSELKEFFSSLFRNKENEGLTTKEAQAFAARVMSSNIGKISV